MSAVLPIFTVLAPYRRLHNLVAKQRLYILTTALRSKTPLPQDSLAARLISVGTVHHDALVLTSRLVKEPGKLSCFQLSRGYHHCLSLTLSKGGKQMVNSLAFLKALSYLLCATTWRVQIDALEEATGELLGVLEDDELL